MVLESAATARIQSTLRITPTSLLTICLLHHNGSGREFNKTRTTNRGALFSTYPGPPLSFLNGQTLDTLREVNTPAVCGMITAQASKEKEEEPRFSGNHQPRYSRIPRPVTTLQPGAETQQSRPTNEPSSSPAKDSNATREQRTKTPQKGSTTGQHHALSRSMPSLTKISLILILLEMIQGTFGRGLQNVTPKTPQDIHVAESGNDCSWGATDVDRNRSMKESCRVPRTPVDGLFTHPANPVQLQEWAKQLEGTSNLRNRTYGYNLRDLSNLPADEKIWKAQWLKDKKTYNQIFQPHIRNEPTTPGTPREFQEWTKGVSGRKPRTTPPTGGRSRFEPEYATVLLGPLLLLLGAVTGHQPSTRTLLMLWILCLPVALAGSHKPTVNGQKAAPKLRKLSHWVTERNGMRPVHLEEEQQPCGPGADEFVRRIRYSVPANTVRDRWLLKRNTWPRAGISSQKLWPVTSWPMQKQLAEWRLPKATKAPTMEEPKNQ